MEEMGSSLTRRQLLGFMRAEQHAWWEGVRPKPDALETLRALRAAGLRVGICSNAPFVALEEQLEHFGFSAHIDGAAFSGAVGWRKPDPRMFEAALRLIGAAAGTTVMVGDTEVDDIAGAQRTGMRAVLYRQSASTPAAHEPTAADATIRRLAELPSLLGLESAPILGAHG